MQQNRAAGISFVMRARNEEQYLKQNFESLKGLTIPHEIIVILHKCTDRSKEISEAAKLSGQPIRIYESDRDLSRPGYENLITPKSHPANLVSFYNWCFSKARFNWIHKWDADFMASPELVRFFNTELKLDEREPTRYMIPCELTPDIINNENYLFNCLIIYTKYVFWETSLFVLNSNHIVIEHKIYSIPPTILKPYWSEPPWFIGNDAILEERYKKLVSICGPEPIGFARASCSECSDIWNKVMDAKDALADVGIHVFK